jgi:NADH dehydrogenase FAD-containing subunit
VTRPRVVIAGLGDTGLLTAIHLGRHADVVGISAKPGLVSGQELGLRLARPDEWARDYWTSFDRFRGLDHVRTVHATLTGLDLDARAVELCTADGTESTETFDLLVISTGVTNGFWRRPDLETAEQVAVRLRARHARLSAAPSVAVIGGGAAAVSVAFNIASTWPDKKVDLYFPGPRALPQHHGRVWTVMERRFRELGVGLHPGHRAVVPAGFDCDDITGGPIGWSTGQDSSEADAVLWAIGRVRPNTEWLPDELLDADGFVPVDRHLRVQGADGVQAGIYAIGDVAATGPLRNSARGRADRLLAHNIRAGWDRGALRAFRPASRRWGSIVGVQGNALEVFTASGRSFTLPAWSALQPLLVGRAIYRGVRGEGAGR